MTRKHRVSGYWLLILAPLLAVAAYQWGGMLALHRYLAEVSR